MIRKLPKEIFGSFSKIPEKFDSYARMFWMDKKDIENIPKTIDIIFLIINTPFKTCLYCFLLSFYAADSGNMTDCPNPDRILTCMIFTYKKWDAFCAKLQHFAHGRVTVDVSITSFNVRIFGGVSVTNGAINHHEVRLGFTSA